MMRRFLIVALLGLLCILGVARAESEAEKSAQTAAVAWMTLWDAGKYDDAYQELARRTKDDVSRAQWRDYWSSVRKPLGKLQSRQLLQGSYAQSSPAAPAQEGVMLEYKTSFASGSQPLTETVGLLRESDGAWRVANYQVK